MLVSPFRGYEAPQCAMCKETLEAEKASGGSLSDGISLSILFMLSLPLLILGGFSLALWRAYRRAGPGSGATPPGAA
ncbi:MAG: hypothetical protein EYC70_02040 [Planctomycetota bacterium]|nr:MAG: hypothetical protein EYC70_02040 [Planctomycetota bacterium]